MDLYNDVNFVRALIVQHANHPNCKLKNEENVQEYLQAKTASATCTDDITVCLKITNNQISEAKYMGLGCAISTSTTDLLLLSILKKNKEEALKIIDEFLKMTTDGTIDENLADLLVFKNVYKQANRIACAQSGALSIKKILENYENH